LKKYVEDKNKNIINTLLNIDPEKISWLSLNFW
jgi:hypothetical protein